MSGARRRDRRGVRARWWRPTSRSGCASSSSSRSPSGSRRLGGVRPHAGQGRSARCWRSRGWRTSPPAAPASSSSSPPHPMMTAVAVLLLAWMLLSIGWAEDPEVARSEALRYALNLVAAADRLQRRAAPRARAARCSARTWRGAVVRRRSTRSPRATPATASRASAAWPGPPTSSRACSSPRCSSPSG